MPHERSRTGAGRPDPDAPADEPRSDRTEREEERPERQAGERPRDETSEQPDGTP